MVQVVSHGVSLFNLPKVISQKKPNVNGHLKDGKVVRVRVILDKIK